MFAFGCNREELPTMAGSVESLKAVSSESKRCGGARPRLSVQYGQEVALKRAKCSIMSSCRPLPPFLSRSLLGFVRLYEFTFAFDCPLLIFDPCIDTFHRLSARSSFPSFYFPSVLVVVDRKFVDRYLRFAFPTQAGPFVLEN